MILGALLFLALLGFIFFLSPAKKLNDEGINWTPLESVCVTMFIYFASQILLAVLIALIAGASGDYDNLTKWFSDNIYGNFVSVVYVEAITFSLIWIFLKKRLSSFKAIGLNRKPKYSDAGYALLAVICYFAVYVAALTIITKYIPSINIDQKQDLGFDKVQKNQLVFVFISLVALPPLVEEIMARGVLYSGLKNKLSSHRAALITSLMFAAAHLQAGSGAPLLWVAAIDTFILSLALIYLKEKTGSLWSPIFLHALKNGVAFLSLFVFHLAKF